MRMVHLLVFSIVGSAALAALGRFVPSSAENQASRAESKAAVSFAAYGDAAGHANASEANEETEGTGSVAEEQRLRGEVLELLDVPNYTYVRFGSPGTEGRWAAVSSAKLSVGSPVEIRVGTTMTSFHSTTLRRTFDIIVFGTVDDGSGKGGAEAPLAGGVAVRPARLQGIGSVHGNAGPQGELDRHASAAAVSGAEATVATTGSPKSIDPIEVHPLPRASGPTGHTVAEVISNRRALAGQTLRIRAVVVKSTPAVLGQTYLHLRDGSGNAQAANNDLAATTSETPRVGETIVMEGTLAIDRDLGSGYRYEAILDDGRILARESR